MKQGTKAIFLACLSGILLSGCGSIETMQGTAYIGDRGDASVTVPGKLALALEDAAMTMGEGFAGSEDTLSVSGKAVTAFLEQMTLDVSRTERPGGQPTTATAAIQSETEGAEGRPGTEKPQEPSEQKDVPEKLHFVDAWGEWFDTDIDPEIARHSYDWQYLENTSTGISYEGDSKYYIRKGIDVSHHQGSIDWAKVKSAGYDFAFLRIGYRGYGEEGNLHVDSTFHDNIRMAKEAGLEIGVYFFSQALNEAEAMEEAQLVIDNLADYTLELPVVFDPEQIRDTWARTDEVTGEQFTKNTLIFCEKIREAGYQPMIYSNLYWESFLFDLKALEEYPIWYADYESVPQTPYAFRFWQYAADGQVDGIDGKVDLNIQFCE